MTMKHLLQALLLVGCATMSLAGVADTPSLTLTDSAAGDEDTAISLTIAGALADASETLTFDITGLPDDAVLSAGTDAGGGTWNDISEGSIGSLTFTSAPHDDTDFVMSVTAKSTDNDGSSASSAAQTIALTVTAVADAPTMTVGAAASADEDNVISLSVDGELVDADLSESIAYVVTGVLDGATLSAGTDLGGGSWSLTDGDLAGLTLTMDAHVADDFQIEFVATVTETRDGGDTASSAPIDGRINITVNDLADAPLLTASPMVSGDEDTAIALTVTSALVDLDGSETLAVIFTGQPADSTFSAGSDAGAGAWQVDAGSLGGLTFTPPADNNDDFTLSVSATTTETETADSAVTLASIDFTVLQVNDAPVLGDVTVDLDENALFGASVTTMTAVNVEPVGAESGQSLAYTMSGTAFAIHPSSGLITVADADQMDFETTPTFVEIVTVIDSGLPPLLTTATVTINLNSLNDHDPEGNPDDISIDELDTAIFNVLDNDEDLDQPAPTLTVTAVNGELGDVGATLDLLDGGFKVGELTINSDGSSTFVTNPDKTVEKFTASATYTMSDGEKEVADVAVNITVNIFNDNQPELTADGVALQTDGLAWLEDQYVTGSPFTVVLNPLFRDLDIDSDGILDSSTSGDNDAITFAVVGNSNPTLIETSLSGGDLALTTPANEHGSADITVRVTDSADPAINIRSVDLTFTVAVTSVNDPPIYNIGSYNDLMLDEDADPETIDLVSSFFDRDITGDSNPDDDGITYTVTIIDTPNLHVTTYVVDETTLPGAVILDSTPAPGQRTITYETTLGAALLTLEADAHGQIDIDIVATDEGVPTDEFGNPVPLFAESSYRITVNALGDDQPIAFDDHYDDYPDLVIDEGSAPIYYNPVYNDYAGDAPLKILNAGQQVIDSSGAQHRYRSSTRLADPTDTGDLQIAINGEVSCAESGCQTLETASTSVDGSGIPNFQVVYKPNNDFNGEDTFTYCIQDSEAAGEDPFTPPADPRCAMVTVMVNPVNDPPVPLDPINFVMDQADDLVVPALDGLRAKVRDVDNTHMDGQGCDPLDPACSSTADTLFFRLQSAVTDNGQLLEPFLSDGSFQYRPDATFSGSDSFLFDVCDVDDFDATDNCVYDVIANIIIEPLEGAPIGSSEGVVEVDIQLSQIPLELPVGPEPNVLIINDDSGSMDWDILTNQASGLYYFETGDYILYILKASAGSSSRIGASEEIAPNIGLWRLRNSAYNTVYYNPGIRYTPWEGLNPDDDEFPDSPATAARNDPLSSGTTNLRSSYSYWAKTVVEEPEVCEMSCLVFDWWGSGCVLEGEVCTGGSTWENVYVANYYYPRHYIWTDKNANGLMDAVPSPVLDPDDSEGLLVEIRPAVEGGSDTYPKGDDRKDCDTTEGLCTYDEELQNFANWFTYARNREYTAKLALGKVVAAAENIRIGYAKLNDDDNLRPIQSMNTSVRTGAKAALLDAIYLTSSSGGTPLRRSLNKAGLHYECEAGDIFGSASSSVPGDAACPVSTAPNGNCQQSFSLLMTDGSWNGSSPSIGDTDDSGPTNFDGGRYASSYSNTLADVAMQYYERDLHDGADGLSNEVPTTGRDRDGAAEDAFEGSGNEFMHQHMTTYTVGFGVNGLVDPDTVPSDYAESFIWGNPTTTERKIDDLLHAAVNGRGDYLSAKNTSDLSIALAEAFEEFSSGSGAAAAVSFNSQEIQEETLVFRAFYNTKINTGDLIAIALTEEGLGDEPEWRAAQQMDLVGYDEREIFTWDPEAAVGIPFRPDYIADSQRDAFISDPAESDAFKNTEVTQRVNYLRGERANERPVGNFRERPTIEGSLGDIVHSKPVFNGPPNRLNRGAEPYPLGDDSYSVFSGTYGGRTKAIYASANDGMLHAFNADTGDELFAYLPNNLMLNDYSRRITDLLDFEYTHKFFVDVTPALNDVFVDLDGDLTKEWASVLVGGHGAGAKAYFALNITNPEHFIEGEADKVVLWEFTEEDDTYPTDADGAPLLVAGDQKQDLLGEPIKDLGYTFSVPTIAMSNLVDGDGNHEWIAVFGNGFNSTSGIAKLYALFLNGGIDGVWCHPDMIHNEVPYVTTMPAICDGVQEFIKLDANEGPRDGYPNGLGTPRGIDVDGNGTIDYAYAGDHFGNFYRFDLTSSDFALWKTERIFEATYNGKDGLGTSVLQPITTQPIVIEHPTEADGFIVIFATGSYVTIPDGVNTEIQSIYGLWDRLSPGLIPKSSLVKQQYKNVIDLVFGNVRTLTRNEVNYTAGGGKKGWYNDLDAVEVGGIYLDHDVEFPGERAIRNIQLRGGLGFVNSVVPQKEESCVHQAGGFALTFCPGTGGLECLGNKHVFDLNNDGNIDGEDATGEDVVAGTRFEDAVPTDSSFIEDKRVTQLSDQELDITGTNTARSDYTGRLSWKQLEVIR